MNERPTPDVPGTVPITGRRFLYVEDRGGESFAKSGFHRLLGAVDPPHMKSGGAMVEGCEAVIADGTRFQAVSYKGDLDGWRRQLEEGARQLGLRLADMSDGGLVICGDRVIPLDEITFVFD